MVISQDIRLFPKHQVIFVAIQLLKVQDIVSCILLDCVMKMFLSYDLLNGYPLHPILVLQFR